MSRIDRAVQKAEREGLLTWTRSDERDRSATALQEPAARPTAIEFEETRGPEIEAEREPTPTIPRDTVPLAEADNTIPTWQPAIEEEPILSPLFVAAMAPTSSAAEQFRLLRTRLEARDASRRTQLMIVTSPRIGDGKTTTSANLALTMSQEFQQKVVLVEADLRRPMLAAMFGGREEPGLVDVLVGAVPLEDALVAIPGQHLYLLPAGLAAERSTELLASSMMHRVLEALRARFSRIVIDTPPVGLADTHVLARLADGILMVVRSGVTPRPAMERALASVDRQRLLGVVLNEVEEAPDAYGYPGLQPAGAGD
jgi:capsular exopolysaccharide synthesis family protein